MSPKEKPSFYLYSRGLSPKLLTLGTLVYDNYAMPEVRSVTFPKLSDSEFNELEKQNHIISEPISGCFTSTKNSSYGLGVEALDLATIDFEFAKKANKLVVAKKGRRVILRNPDSFFGKVFQNDDIREQLTLWLTAAKSQWIFYKATFQKPRIFCVTGFYELGDVVAKTEHVNTASATLGVSSIVAATTIGVPVGVKIGPFKNGATLTANIDMPQPSIWAARFHQLTVEYLQMASEGTTPLPSTIRLRQDCTHPREGLMKDGPVIQETKKVDQPDDIKIANGVQMKLGEINEISEDAEPGDDYWSAFNVAEARLKKAEKGDDDCDSDSDDDADDDADDD